MDRQEAAEALQLLKKVVAQARDDTALENWGLVWMFGGLVNGGGFIATHFMLKAGLTSPLPFILLWTPIIAVCTVSMFLKGRAGARSFVESQVWTIWNTFIAAMVLAAVVNLVVGLSTLFMPAIAAILVAFAFSMMGSTIGTWWYAPAALWGALAIVLARLPDLQFLLFGVAWAVTQVVNGVLLQRARTRKLADRERPRLV